MDSDDVGIVFPHEQVEIGGRHYFAGAVAANALVASVEVGADVGVAFDQIAVARQYDGRDKAVT